MVIFYLKATKKSFMTKKQRRIIALASVAFICQLLFPQLSKAQIIPTQKGLEEYSVSMLLVKNSPQPIIFDASINLNMSKTNSTATTIVADKVASASLKAIAAPVVKESDEDDKDEIRAYVLAEAVKFGLNPREVELIVKCESTWNDKATHTNRNGSIDAGLWQINSLHKSLSFEEKMDYKIATDWALKKRVHDGNWSAWYCAKRMGIKT